MSLLRHQPAFSGGKSHRYAPYKNGKRSAGVVKASGRGQVITPARLMTCATVVRKTEREIRAAESRGDSNIYAPHATDDEVVSVRKGEIGMCIREVGGTFRPALTADSNVVATSSVNGLSRDKELFSPCVFQAESFVGDKDSNNQVTIAFEGLQTVYATGCEPITVGDSLYLDPNPYMVEDEHGNQVPGIQGPKGIPASKATFQIRKFDATSMHSFLHTLKMDALKDLRRDERQASLKQATSAEKLVKLIENVCRTVCTNHRHIADDMPARNYLFLWLAFRILAMAKIASFTKDNMMPVWLLSLRALRKVLQEDERNATDLHRDYAATLPHATDPLTRHKDFSVDSVYLDKLLDSDELLKSKDTIRAKLMEADARLSVFAQDRMEIAMHRQRQYLARYAFGTALSSANKGGQLDVNVGRNQ